MYAGFLVRRRFQPVFYYAKQTIMSMSSTVANSLKPLYRWQEEVEALEEYRSGGYHPVLLDNTYLNRYRVVHKLGYGTYSTVWLAKDCVADKYVSLKFITARASAYSKEALIMNHINRNNRENLGRRFVMSLLDEFTLNGPNGDHACLVSQALGPTVLEVKESCTCDLLPLDIAKRATVELALGLACIHSCGIIHGGTSGPLGDSSGVDYTNHLRYSYQKPRIQNLGS